MIIRVLIIKQKRIARIQYYWMRLFIDKGSKIKANISWLKLFMFEGKAPDHWSKKVNKVCVTLITCLDKFILFFSNIDNFIKKKWFICTIYFKGLYILWSIIFIYNCTEFYEIHLLIILIKRNSKNQTEDI